MPTAHWLLKASLKTCRFCALFKPQNFAVNYDFKMHQFLPPAVRVCGLAWSWCSICSGRDSWAALSVTVCSHFVLSPWQSSTRSVLGEKQPSFVQPHQLLSMNLLCFSGGSSRINLAGTVPRCSVPLLFLKHSALRSLKRGTIRGVTSQEILTFKEFMLLAVLSFLDTT